MTELPTPTTIRFSYHLYETPNRGQTRWAPSARLVWEGGLTINGKHYTTYRGDDCYYDLDTEYEHAEFRGMSGYGNDFTDKARSLVCHQGAALVNDAWRSMGARERNALLKAAKDRRREGANETILRVRDVLARDLEQPAQTATSWAQDKANTSTS